jgi:phosphatidylglycerophosphatase A
MQITHNKAMLSKLVNNCLFFIVTCGYIGYIPGPTGTYASIFGCIILYFLPYISAFSGIIFVIGFAVFSTICVNLLEYEGEDPSYIVIDELTGIFITMAGHQPTFLNLVIGFILFRFFDIIKPYPIRRLERWRKGYGVVTDDCLAGVFANILLWLGCWAVSAF